MPKSYIRPITNELVKTIHDEDDRIRVIIGPRQVGKTTAARQLELKAGMPTIYSAADRLLPQSTQWIESQWESARLTSQKTKKKTLLILDEIQKVSRWSEIVKALWDEDRRHKHKVVPLLLGSSSLLLQEGLSESLSGRFQLIRFTHWEFKECSSAFDLDLQAWLFFGGYPGALQYRGDEEKWRSYISDSLIETAITRDVLQMQKITKPTLLRHLFALSALYPAQIFSYNKMLGQLQDAGNTTTLSHYLKLLESAFLISGLELYSVGQKRKRGSSPKLILWNNALVNAFSGKTLEEARKDSFWWGRVVENAVGAHLLNHLQGIRYQITYWRDGDLEVDFVVQVADKIWGVEVKSGRPERKPGLEAFLKRYPKARTLTLGSGGMPLREFFSSHPSEIFK